MSKVEKVEHYITVSNVSELSLITDMQFGERFTSNALNRHWKNIKPVGIYCGFEPSIVDTDKIQIGDNSDKNTLVAQVQSGEFQLTVHQKKPITVTIPRDQKMTAVVEAFYQFGVLTKQVDAKSNIDAATLKLIPNSHVESHHVQLFSVFFPSSDERLTDEHIDTSVRSYGAFSREAMESMFVRKTADGGAMIVPFSSDDSNPPEGLERWNPVKKRVEYSKSGKWNGMGGGGSSVKDVDDDTALASGEGCIVDTITAQKQVVVTLSGNGNATGGDEHIVGDIKSGHAFKYPITVIAEGDTTIDNEDEFLIDIDGARVTFNYNEEKDNWELSSGFGERPTPKAVFHPFEARVKKGDTTFNLSYSVGFITYSLNGVEQSTDDFTATDGKTITLSKPIKRDGDVVQFKAWLLADQSSDITYTRKDWSGKALRGATSISLPTGFLQNDLAKAYYLEIGGVRQWADTHYKISSATNEILLNESLDNDYECYLLSEAQVQLFVGQDSQIDADNTNNSLTGKTVKENIDQLDDKYEKFLLSQTGMVGPFHNAGAVDGWLDLKGGTVSRTVDAILWQYAQTTGLIVEQELKDAEQKKYAMHFGDGNGVDTFTLPNHHLGHFERGTPADVEHGETQGDAIRNITGGVRSSYASNTASNGALIMKIYGNSPAKLGLVGGDPGANYAISIDASKVVPTSTENRPYTANLSIKIFRGWIQ